MNWATLRNEMIDDAIEYGIGNVIDESHEGAYNDDENDDNVYASMSNRIDAFAKGVMCEIETYVTMTMGRNAMTIALLQGGINDDDRHMSHDVVVDDDTKQQFVKCVRSLMH